MNSPQSIPLADLERSIAASFETPGASYVGRFVAFDQRQQTDIRGQLLSFADGAPRMQWLITVEQANGDHVTFYAKGGNFKAARGSGDSMLAAIAAAVRAAGAGAVAVGGELTVA